MIFHFCIQPSRPMSSQNASKQIKFLANIISRNTVSQHPMTVQCPRIIKTPARARVSPALPLPTLLYLLNFGFYYSNDKILKRFTTSMEHLLNLINYFLFSQYEIVHFVCKKHKFKLNRFIAHFRQKIRCVKNYLTKYS